MIPIKSTYFSSAYTNPQTMVGGFLNNEMIITLNSLSAKGRFSSRERMGRFSDIINPIPDRATKLVLQKNFVIAIFWDKVKCPVPEKVFISIQHLWHRWLSYSIKFHINCFCFFPLGNMKSIRGKQMILVLWKWTIFNLILKNIQVSNSFQIGMLHH